MRTPRNTIVYHIFKYSSFVLLLQSKMKRNRNPCDSSYNDSDDIESTSSLQPVRTNEPRLSDGSSHSIPQGCFPSLEAFAALFSPSFLCYCTDDDDVRVPRIASHRHRGAFDVERCVASRRLPSGHRTVRPLDHPRKYVQGRSDELGIRISPSLSASMATVEKGRGRGKQELFIQEYLRPIHRPSPRERSLPLGVISLTRCCRTDGKILGPHRELHQ
jgi:hypothetical protein